MKAIRILVTSTGSPGTTTLVRKLKEVKERKICVIATDMNSEAGGRFLADRFYAVPPAKEEDSYVDSIISILQDEKIDVFFPVSDFEVPVIAKNKERILEKVDTKIIVNDYKSIIRASNKYILYKTLKEETNVQIPKFYAPESLDEFVECVKLLGYPQEKVCFKPHLSKGSRGFRIISESVNRRDFLLNHKPNSLYMAMDEFISIFRGEKDFPDLLVMEHLEDVNYDAMVLGNGRESLLTTIKTREEARWGTIVKGALVYKPELIEACNKIAGVFGLKYNNSVQFIGNKVLEINPRTSTYIYWTNFIEPYLSIKKILQEITDEEIQEYKNKIPYGTRFCRYMDQVSFKG